MSHTTGYSYSKHLSDGVSFNRGHDIQCRFVVPDFGLGAGTNVYLMHRVRLEATLEAVAKVRLAAGPANTLLPF